MSPPRPNTTTAAAAARLPAITARPCQRDRQRRAPAAPSPAAPQPGRTGRVGHASDPVGQRRGSGLRQAHQRHTSVHRALHRADHLQRDALASRPDGAAAGGSELLRQALGVAQHENSASSMKTTVTSRRSAAAPKFASELKHLGVRRARHPPERPGLAEVAGATTRSAARHRAAVAGTAAAQPRRPSIARSTVASRGRREKTGTAIISSAEPARMTMATMTSRGAASGRAWANGDGDAGRAATRLDGDHHRPKPAPGGSHAANRGPPAPRQSPPGHRRPSCARLSGGLSGRGRPAVGSWAMECQSPPGMARARGDRARPVGPRRLAQNRPPRPARA